MELTDHIYSGPPISDPDMQAALPSDLSRLIGEINGFVQFRGGLHVRGVCAAPTWHSLQRVWTGARCLHVLYNLVRPDDVPFAQDCVGDQFVLRDGEVLHLFAETGELEGLAVGLDAFLDAAKSDPIGYLSLEPLLQLLNEGTVLEPGELIHAHPPFCTAEAADGVSLRAVPAEELMAYHAELASQLPADGGSINFQWVD